MNFKKSGSAPFDATVKVGKNRVCLVMKAEAEILSVPHFHTQTQAG